MAGNADLHPGILAAEKGDTLIALMELEKIENHTSLTRSYYAFTIARERGEFQKALSLCRESMKDEPNETTHFLNLGRIFLAAGHKEKAIETFRKGLRLGRNPRITHHLEKLGIRKPGVFPSLDRDNPLNKYMGKILARIGLR